MSQDKYIDWQTVMLALCMTEFVLHHFPTPRIGAFHCIGEKKNEDLPHKHETS